MAEPKDFLDSDPFDPVMVEGYENAVQEANAGADDRARDMLARRRQAYVNVFTAGKREQVDIDIVLNDLMYFCKAWDNTYNVHDGEHANVLSRMKEGRREVFYRVKDFMKLDIDTLLLKYTNATTK